MVPAPRRPAKRPVPPTTTHAPASVGSHGWTIAWYRSEKEPDPSAQVKVLTRWKVKAAAWLEPVPWKLSLVTVPDAQTPPPDAVKVLDPSNGLSESIDTGAA